MHLTPIRSEPYPNPIKFNGKTHIAAIGFESDFNLSFFHLSNGNISPPHKDIGRSSDIAVTRTANAKKMKIAMLILVS